CLTLSSGLGPMGSPSSGSSGCTSRLSRWSELVLYEVLLDETEMLPTVVPLYRKVAIGPVLPQRFTKSVESLSRLIRTVRSSMRTELMLFAVGSTAFGLFPDTKRQPEGSQILPF